MISETLAWMLVSRFEYFKYADHLEFSSTIEQCRKQKQLMSSSSLGGKNTLVRDIRRKWPDWIAVVGKLRLLKLISLQNYGEKKSISERISCRTLSQMSYNNRRTTSGSTPVRREQESESNLGSRI